MTVLGIGAGVSASAVTDYTINGTAQRTFTASSEAVYQATRSALKRMDMTEQTDRGTDQGRALTARAGDREVEIELLTLTTRATQMRVTVKQGVFWRDRATAGEFIAQAQDALDRATALSQKNGERKNGSQTRGPSKNPGTKSGPTDGALTSSEPGDGHLKDAAAKSGAPSGGERRRRETLSYEDVGLSP